jgi:hypothetical protein
MELGGAGGRRPGGGMQNYAESRNAFRFSWIDFNRWTQEEDSSSVHQQWVEEEAEQEQSSKLERMNRAEEKSTRCDWRRKKKNR